MHLSLISVVVEEYDPAIDFFDQPAHDTETAVADYIAWLRAGHER